MAFETVTKTTGQTAVKKKQTKKNEPQLNTTKINQGCSRLKFKTIQLEIITKCQPYEYGLKHVQQSFRLHPTNLMYVWAGMISHMVIIM